MKGFDQTQPSDYQDDVYIDDYNTIHLFEPKITDLDEIYSYESDEGDEITYEEILKHVS